jgi:DNA repair exonuclease SbcCD ATPase subunit
MIYIDKIKIHEFRGIRDLSLDLNGKNFATCGPNGTGKSGIVDAIEFALTGNISRLAGAGTGGISVKQHGPHVDSRDKPEQASVTLELILPSLSASATIHRTVKNAGSPTISPDTPEVRAILDGAALHPEFVLSRRELIRYVVSNPGERSKHVQVLLRLDVIEKLRTVLQKIANTFEREAKGCERTKQNAIAQLKSALAITQFDTPSILAAVNHQRQVLELAPIMTLETHTSLKDGLATASDGEATSKVAKAQAQSSLTTLQDQLSKLADVSFKEACDKARAIVLELTQDSDSLQAISRDGFIREALKHFDEEHCPVCDVAWDPAAFRAHLAAKLERFSRATAKRKALETQLNLIVGEIATLRSAISSVRALGVLPRNAPE